MQEKVVIREKKVWQEPKVTAVADVRDTRGVVPILQRAEVGVVYFS